MIRRIPILLLSLCAAPVWALQAQPVPVPEDQSTAPQIDIAGVGIATGGASAGDESPKLVPGINFSDSALMIGAAQRLYHGGAIGSLGLGAVTTDEAVGGMGSGTFLHQAFGDFQTESFEALLGRSDNPTAHLVDFPTLREDDLITLTNPLNPFSNGQNVEAHRYSNLGSVTFNQNLRFFENVHAQHLIASSGSGSSEGINSFGISFQYLGTPGLEAFERFPSWGVGYEHLSPVGSASGGLHQISAGGVLNLNESVTDRWDLRVQDILSLGSSLRDFTDVTDTYRADSNSIAASLRYLHSPFGLPGAQLALTAAFKKYINVREARSAGFALTGVRRLGQGFDLVAQYRGQWRESALAAVESGSRPYEQAIEAGFIFNFDAVFNEHISPRRSILNQKHRYIPN